MTERHTGHASKRRAKAHGDDEKNKTPSGDPIAVLSALMNEPVELGSGRFDLKHLAELSHYIAQVIVSRTGHIPTPADSEKAELPADPLVQKTDAHHWRAGYLKDVSTLLGGHTVLGSMIESDLEAHELLYRGLPRAALSSLIGKLHDIPVIEVSEALGISLRTLQRHKSDPAAYLDAQQSGRTWEFAKILAKATHVLGSQDEAEQWLRRPAIGLDQERPVDLLTTPAGVKLVEDYLERLEYNVYT
jgi:putative toxin-antitoxin system antitoxin component (TIGR02293 family)